jgi:hypothetical protein
MKTRYTALAIALTGVMIGGLAQADIAFTVDPAATQFAYVNAFNISDDSFATGFGYNPVLSTSAFSGNTQILGPNTDIYTGNNGGAVGEDGFWFTGDQSGTQIKYVEVATYQEAGNRTIGETITFDFTVTANTLLSNGYTGIGFIKVLDAGGSWATTQFEQVDSATLGDQSLSLVVADAGAGTETVQAGFAITGLYVDTATAAGLGTVEVIPEPATGGLMALFGIAIVMLRRNSNKNRED